MRIRRLCVFVVVLLSSSFCLFISLSCLGWGFCFVGLGFVVICVWVRLWVRRKRVNDDLGNPESDIVPDGSASVIPRRTPHPLRAFILGVRTGGDQGARAQYVWWAAGARMVDGYLDNAVSYYAIFIFFVFAPLPPTRLPRKEQVDSRAS
ncbi:hypothetical protein C8R45DRAFT_1108873 [Mycena sanguinolenta]|nr:hypothetical protein C8R45DRAFT_1108873 [Mycena sanguinolenta]